MATLTIITQNLDGNGRGEKIRELYKEKGKNLEKLKDKIKEDIDKSNFIKDQPEAQKSVDKAPCIEDLKLTISECIKENYMDKYGKEIIYAFQELGNKEKGARKTSYITRTIVPECYHKDTGVSGRAKEIWDEVFPWAKFANGYWDECDIQFAGKKIKIINFHSSPRHDLAIRYILWKRIPEVSSRYTILLGDFNAAFKGQTEAEGQDIKESRKFLERTEEYGFKECMIDGETEKNPHYTHSYIIKANDPKNNKLVRNKLDHIFISESLFELLKGLYMIEYLDEVNQDPKKLNEEGEEVSWFSSKKQNKNDNNIAFTDHSGIKLTITLPDP